MFVAITSVVRLFKMRSGKGARMGLLSIDPCTECNIIWGAQGGGAGFLTGEASPPVPLATPLILIIIFLFHLNRSSVRVVLILGASLGLPWVFALLNFNQYTVAFNYLFVLTNGFQVRKRIMFLLYITVINKEIIHYFKCVSSCGPVQQYRTPDR